MSNAVLSQLVEAEAQLASQETQLVTKVSAIQEQRKGLQTVIDMFQSPADSNGAGLSIEALTEAVTATKAATATETTKTARKAKTPSKAKKAPAKSAKAPATTKTVAKKTAKATKAKAASKAPAATSTRKAKAGKAPNWQRYVQEPFKKSPLPDVVANILNAQPEQVFKIAEIMEAIFKSDMPKATFLKARNRVSNILSAGARNGDWGRGRGGTYSMSKSALPK